MPTPPSDDDLKQELDAAAKKAGVTIQPDRHDAIMTSYKELKGMVALVRAQPRSAAVEPSNVYSLAPRR
ncbi:hypothetical protein [Reyranella sp. CPCC 100927]|uniref:hypothetical protein n=1 Tax=Reyranella sp. CPCC 100927 TaxID=2599616 RepID=UPI0011B5AA6F|nr:hypothetical protein [Reyranella sp. CPCC 100927]TWS94998.1 hypothetical protein FQU96_40845 [Reyranella sp. CPCC 100927]